jgi:UDPglucose 6-dehydrogenase
LQLGADITVYDPEAMNNVKQVLANSVHFAEHQYEALSDADALVIATEWSEFRTPDFGRIISLLKNKVIFDGRNLFDLNKMEDMGFHYVSVGRRTVNPVTI